MYPFACGGFRIAKQGRIRRWQGYHGVCSSPAAGGTLGVNNVRLEVVLIVLSPYIDVTPNSVSISS